MLLKMGMVFGFRVRLFGVDGIYVHSLAEVRTKPKTKVIRPTSNTKKNRTTRKEESERHTSIAILPLSGADG